MESNIDCGSCENACEKDDGVGLRQMIILKLRLHFQKIHFSTWILRQKPIKLCRAWTRLLARHRQ